MDERSTGDFDWGRLVAGSVHPAKVEVIEAMRWVGAPMSASAVSKSCGGMRDVGNVAYHIKRMARQGILKRVSSRQARGALEVFYELVA